MSVTDYLTIGVVAFDVDPDCCCGHPQSQHHTTPMSVPLSASGAPTYRLPPCSPITYRGPLTYTNEQCPCGCTVYEPQ